MDFGKEVITGDSSKEVSSYADSPFFNVHGVEVCCFSHLRNTFDVLLLQKKVKQQELADYLGIDKAYVSRMCNGLTIPPLTVRLKVAQFFGVDSVLIWRVSKIQSADKLKVENAVSVSSEQLPKSNNVKDEVKE
jgi:plasmid maintenance system antidote protein VapI